MREVVIFFLVAMMMGIYLVEASQCYKLCRIGRTHGMKSEECYNISLRTIPECLSKDVEVLDLSLNRITRITKKQLERFGRLKLLYLSDNKIMTIDSDAFDSNTDLQVLDLSLNPIVNLPKNLFQLPSLRKLYLSENEWLNIIKTIEEAKPITSPLEYLDISAIHMKTLPDLGVMPYMVKYNISNIPDDVVVTAKHFAGLCNLKFLENSKLSPIFEDPCECHVVENWLRERKVRFKPFNCTLEYAKGCSLNVSAENMALFEECKTTYNKLILNSKLVKILVPIIVVVIIIALLVVFIMLKRNRRRLQAKTKSIPKTDGQTLI